MKQRAAKCAASQASAPGAARPAPSVHGHLAQRLGDLLQELARRGVKQDQARLSQGHHGQAQRHHGDGSGSDRVQQGQRWPMVTGCAR